MSYGAIEPEECDPLTEEQLETLRQALRLVQCTPDGEGSVTITVKSHHIRHIQPSLSFDLRSEIAERKRSIGFLSRLLSSLRDR